MITPNIKLHVTIFGYLPNKVVYSITESLVNFTITKIIKSHTLYNKMAYDNVAVFYSFFKPPSLFYYTCLFLLHLLDVCLHKNDSIEALVYTRYFYKVSLFEYVLSSILNIHLKKHNLKKQIRYHPHV